MQLKIRYFAAFREAVGQEAEAVDSSARTPGELFEECRRRHPGLQRYAASLVAVNDDMAGWDSVLSEGDDVLFFPPVAGG